MAIGDMNTNGFDVEAARYARNNRQQQPDFAPGMGDTFGGSVMNNSGDSMGFGDMSGGFQAGGDGDAGFNANVGGFGDMSGGASFGGGTDVGGQFGAGAGGGSFGVFNTGVGLSPQQQQQQAPVKTDEDKIIEAVVKVGKAGKTFGSDIIESFRQVTPAYWESYGRTVSGVSAACFGAGLVASLFGVSGATLMIGSCVSCAVGVVTLMFTTEKARGYSSKYKEDNTDVPVSEPQEYASSEPDMFNDSDFNFDGGNDDFGSNDEEDEYGDDEYDDDWNFDDVSEPIVEPAMSTEEAFESLQEVDKGMFTRSYLYEMFTKVLPNMKPDFSELKEVEEDTDAFELWAEKLVEAAEVLNCKEENYPELLSLRENAFIIVVECTRAIGIKVDALAEEVANIYAYQDGSRKKGVYAVADSVGKRSIITIFTGDSVMVSLKDMYRQVEENILDTKNYIPVVIGMNQVGKVYWFDFKKLESILITGMPRKGKSWFAQAVLVQMCALVPPSDLYIYICDPKDGISDYADFKLPHVKKFVTDDASILEEVRKLVKEEAPRRKKLIGDSHNVNIWDFKKEYPDVKLPVIYILIDEVVTLAERMEKEVKQQFQKYIVELISQLPALGIRGIFVPHVVKDAILPKTATDLIPCRVSVCGDATHIEACTATKPRDFKFKLTNLGDMAVRMPDIAPETLYIHAPVLTDSNMENRKLFEYLRRCWNKLQPEETDGSRSAVAIEENETRDLLNTLSDDEDIGVFADTNEEGDSFLSGLED